MAKKKNRVRPGGMTTNAPQAATPVRGGSQPSAAVSQPLSQVDRPEVAALIRALENLRGSRVISYFLDETASIAFDAMPSFYSQLRAIGNQEKIDLWIHSHGGTTEVPWRIVQMVRAYCNRFGVLVTEVAQSAATHIALGADEIVMGAFSLLSPVDPQRRHPLLPKDPDGKDLPISVQDLKHAVEFIKREAGESGLSGEAYSQVITALFDKVHPLAIGAIEQSYALSKLITKRMLATHMDESSEGEEIQRLADALCDDYKSHQFPIGLLEAKRLGLKVTQAPDDVYDAMWNILNYYQAIDRMPQPLPANTQVNGQPIQGTAMMSTIAHLDSTQLRIDCRAIAQVARDGKATGRGSIWLPLAN